MEDAIENNDPNDPCKQLAVSKSQQINIYVFIVLVCVEFYVDIFLLWLLYKFMKP